MKLFEEGYDQLYPAKPKKYLEALLREAGPLIRDYNSFLSDKTPDRHGYEVPYGDKWREYKARELESLIRHLDKINDEWHDR